MENSKRPSKYHLSINFLAQKKKPFFHLQKVQNSAFSVISKYRLSINFLAKKTRISHLGKVQNKNFPIISKYNFLAQKRPYFSSPESLKQELFINQ